MQANVIPGLDEQDLSLFKIFHPFAFEKTVTALMSEARFAHYTSADTALKIIGNEEVWMRKSTCMNDFMELEHGFACLARAYAEHKDRFQSIFEAAFPNFASNIEDRFNAWLPSFRNNTYISCISEHDPSDDQIGRLSMWRAYGGSAGVALIVKSKPLLAPNDALNAYTSPVAYLNEEQFGRHFEEVLNGFEEHLNIILELGEQQLLARIFEVFRMAMLCTKHPGFAEEREWRIIYSPSFVESAHITPGIFTFNGVPQKIFKIPLKNIPEQNLLGIEIPELLDRVIVGPTQFPVEIKEAIGSVLAEKKIAEPYEMIHISDIPLRN
ncbi:DUF2971 domain-containing protein [Martelella sp. AMO21009]